MGTEVLEQLFPTGCSSGSLELGSDQLSQTQVPCVPQPGAGLRYGPVLSVRQARSFATVGRAWRVGPGKRRGQCL